MDGQTKSKLRTEILLSNIGLVTIVGIFKIKPICDYVVRVGNGNIFGQKVFGANIYWETNDFLLSVFVVNSNQLEWIM